MMQRSLLAIFFLLLFSPFSVAQNGNNTQNSLLPEIDPQDIEIRSEFRARFPGLRRQPILGFNPKPRVFQIDPNRMPFMESPEQAVASISMTQLDRPQPPARTILKKPNRMTALIRGGFGSFSTPELEAYGYKRINEKSLFSGNLNYQSSTGHLDTQDSGFRFFDLNGVYGTQFNEDLKASVRAGIFNDYNNLFNLIPAIPVTGDETAQKDYTGFDAGLILQRNKNALEGWEYYANASVVGIELAAANAALAGKVDQQALDTGIEYKWAGSELYETYTIKADLGLGNYSTVSTGDTQWLNGQAQMSYGRLLNYNTELDLSAGLAYISDGISSKVRFVTDLGFEYSVNDKVSVKGGIFARPELRNMWEHHQKNRFLGAGSALQQEYYTGVRAGVEYKPLEMLDVYSNLRYEHISNLAYYDRALQNFGGIDEHTFYEINYGNANRIYFDVGLSQQVIMEKLWFDLNLYAQQPKLSDDTDVPFEEKLGFNLAVNLKPTTSLSIRSWVQYTGERSAPSTAETLGSFTLVNASADYDINDRFGLYIKVLNILDQQYEVWEGYQERSLQVFGGIKLKL